MHAALAMRRFLLAAAVVCGGAAAMAVTIDPTWLEGDPGLRARLEGLQNKIPPDVLATKWVNCKPLSFFKLRGRVVVLEFWAPWSEHCRELIPRNNTLYERYREQGLTWLAVCTTQSAGDFDRAVRDLGITYPVCLDDSNFSDMRFAVDSYPDYYIIDRQGTIVAADCENERVEDIIKLLLAEPAP